MLDSLNDDLNNMLNKQDLENQAYERFVEYTKDQFSEVCKLISEIEEVAKDFEGYDFTDSIEVLLKS